jgi:hypothetical protein
VPRTAAVASALAALVAVTACGPVHTGAAATVGHTRISVAQVRAATKASLAASGTSADTPEAERAALNTLISNDMLSDAAAAKNVTVSEGDVQDLLVRLRAAYGSDEGAAAQLGVPVASLHDFLHQGLFKYRVEQSVAPGQTDPTALLAALTNYEITLAKQRGVTVSPRYGAWDPAQLGVVAANGFSTPFKAPIAVQSPIAAPAS